MNFQNMKFLSEQEIWRQTVWLSKLKNWNSVRSSKEWKAKPYSDDMKYYTLKLEVYIMTYLWDVQVMHEDLCPLNYDL